MKKQTKHQSADDLRGVSQLAIDATTGVTDLVEALHRNITRVPGITPALHNGRTTGITGAVYHTIRTVTQIVGSGIDSALALLAPELGSFTNIPEREHIQSAINGVLGDHLLKSQNPLAITMQFRRDGQTLNLNRVDLQKSIPTPSGKVLVLVHGLCMNDRQWNQNRSDGSKHNHGTALQNDLGYTAIYLHYNSGLNIANNGEQFSNLLAQLIRAWPVEVEEIAIVAHSMGGLVTRYAHHYARISEHSWPTHTSKIVFLGTPHFGAPLERGGHWFDTLLGSTLYTAPFAKIGKIRSAGITDLRYGMVLDSQQKPLLLPENVHCFAIAGITERSDQTLHKYHWGDGLVQQNSALGINDNPNASLNFPSTHCITLAETNHIQLLSSQHAYHAIKQCLEMHKQ